MHAADHHPRGTGRLIVGIVQVAVVVRLQAGGDPLLELRHRGGVEQNGRRHERSPVARHRRPRAARRQWLADGPGPIQSAWRIPRLEGPWGRQADLRDGQAGHPLGLLNRPQRLARLAADHSNRVLRRDLGQQADAVGGAALAQADGQAVADIAIPPLRIGQRPQPLDVVRVVRQRHGQVALVAEVRVEMALADPHDLAERIWLVRLGEQRFAGRVPTAQHVQQHGGIDPLAPVRTGQVGHDEFLRDFPAIDGQAAQQPEGLFGLDPRHDRKRPLVLGIGPLQVDPAQDLRRQHIAVRRRLAAEHVDENRDRSLAQLRPLQQQSPQTHAL